MPDDMVKSLSKPELRDLIELLATQKAGPATPAIPAIAAPPEP